MHSAQQMKIFVSFRLGFFFLFISSLLVDVGFLVAVTVPITMWPMSHLTHCKLCVSSFSPFNRISGFRIYRLWITAKNRTPLRHRSSKTKWAVHNSWIYCIDNHWKRLLKWFRYRRSRSVIFKITVILCNMCPMPVPLNSDMKLENNFI